MEGVNMEKDFLKTLVAATGLPENLIQNEIKDLAGERGFDYQKMTMEDLRSIMVTYLQKELLKAKKQYS